MVRAALTSHKCVPLQAKLAGQFTAYPHVLSHYSSGLERLVESQRTVLCCIKYSTLYEVLMDNGKWGVSSWRLTWSRPNRTSDTVPSPNSLNTISRSPRGTSAARDPTSPQVRTSSGSKHHRQPASTVPRTPRARRGRSGQQCSSRHRLPPSGPIAPTSGRPASRAAGASRGARPRPTPSPA